MPRKILLADDSVTAQNMGRKILQDAGYEVVTVNNGSAALKKVAEAKPELIVLDVYMPGYSGLEVCQRLKETRETADIPVLLTVGKLEPFKQEEARRVRADAFIVKPFEASELLAALGKLEDRIVSGPSSVKEAKPSGTMAEFERFVGQRGARYGDEESGWKARLTIPAAGAKLTEPEAEPAKAISSSFRELVPEEKPRIGPVPFTTTERPIPAGIPQDITPDEIAALAAAAARLRTGVAVGKDFERLGDKGSEAQSSVKNKDEAVTRAAEVEARDKAMPAEAVAPNLPEKEPVGAPNVESASATAKAEIEKELETKKAAVSAAPTTSAAPTGIAETDVQPASQGIPTAAEVDVVLESMATGKGAASTTSTTLASIPVREAETVVAAASSPTATMAVGARWVAEEVAIDAAEAVLVLESEMRKAHAAFAAAENAAPKNSEPALIEKYEPATVDKADEPIFASMAPPAIGAPVPVAENPQTADTSAEASETVSSFKEAQHEISRPPAPPFTPPTMSAEDELRHGAPALGGPHLSEAENMSTSVVPTTSASEVADVSSQGKQAGDQTSTVRREADLASATAATWASWKDIRENMSGAKVDSPRSQGERGPDLEQLKSLKDLKPESQPAVEPEAAMAAAASADGSSAAETGDANLSSIVDSMLAELKPKLMAELAEKLKKEKK